MFGKIESKDADPKKRFKMLKEKSPHSGNLIRETEMWSLEPRKKKKKKKSCFLKEDDGFVLSLSSQEPSASPPGPSTCSATPLGNKDTGSFVTLLAKAKADRQWSKESEADCDRRAYIRLCA